MKALLIQISFANIPGNVEKTLKRLQQTAFFVAPCILRCTGCVKPRQAYDTAHAVGSYAEWYFAGHCISSVMSSFMRGVEHNNALHVRRHYQLSVSL